MDNTSKSKRVPLAIFSICMAGFGLGAAPAQADEWNTRNAQFFAGFVERYAGNPEGACPAMFRKTGVKLLNFDAKTQVVNVENTRGGYSDITFVMTRNLEWGTRKRVRCHQGITGGAGITKMNLCRKGKKTDNLIYSIHANGLRASGNCADN